MASARFDHRRHMSQDKHEMTPKPSADPADVSGNRDDAHDKLSKGTPLDTILGICREPPRVRDMEHVNDKNTLFMILPFKYDASRPNREPNPINDGKGYADQWDADHVRMPCSAKYISRNKNAMWPMIREWLHSLQQKCNNKTASIEDLKRTIENCAGRDFDTYCLELLINEGYSKTERTHFMSTILSNICSLALSVDVICSRSLPLLRSGSSKSVTMSQRQAASLLACAFFCLFPNRSEHDQTKDYEKFQNPNFNRLYQRGSPEKTEKLRCILHYFKRITEKMPNGVISFRRFVLLETDHPQWPNSKVTLCDMHLTTSKKIEDVNGVLQVDFANKYIGGGVLGNGCVQEEIRFSICPEMLVSLLICEVMEPNECVFLTGCEQYSSYDGYADSFKFAGNYEDNSPKDNWGRKWCHLVAMDAVFFRDRVAQYDMKSVKRELIKAYASFRPRKSHTGAETAFGIVTGNWGCGAFNGDKQLKAIIQLMVASEARRPLIYAAYGDKNFTNSFAQVYEFLKARKTTVGDLYRYLEGYSTQHTRGLLFDYILTNPISSHKS